MDFFRAIILGAIQGLTEYLPISSSAHLAIYPQLFGWEDPGAAFTAVVQIGTEVAVILYFRKEILAIARGWFAGWVNKSARQDFHWKMGWFIIIGSIPIVVLGLTLESLIDEQFRNLWVIGSTLIILGIILGLAEKFGKKVRPIEDLKWWQAVALGFAQAAALIPGVSRSGATITLGLFLGLERAAATRYAFLLAIPAVTGAGLYKLKDVPGGENIYGVPATITATIVSFVVGLAVIHWLLKWVSTKSFAPFVGYRIALGVVVLSLLSVGVLNP